MSPPEAVGQCSLTQYSVTLWNLTPWNNENGLYLVSFLILCIVCILTHPDKGFIGITELPGVCVCGGVGTEDSIAHTQKLRSLIIALGRHVVSL